MNLDPTQLELARRAAQDVVKNSGHTILTWDLADGFPPIGRWPVNVAVPAVFHRVARNDEVLLGMFRQKYDPDGTSRWLFVPGERRGEVWLLSPETPRWN